MAKIREEKPRNLVEFVQLVEKVQAFNSGQIWYRGCGRSDHRLLPSLYRHKSETSIEALSVLEKKLMMRFRQRSIPFHNRSLADDWDALFFMQHYGAPTRLLDWTENPMVALYFATTTAKFKEARSGKRRYEQDAALWILDPVAWNRDSLKHQSYDGGILTPGDDALKGYKPSPSFTGMFNHPVAVYGAHNSPRIVAQRGVFTIFGQNSKPMEEVYDEETFPSDCLIKVVLGKDHLGALRTSIFNYGVTESVVFPDLEGLAREVRRTFGFDA